MSDETDSLSVPEFDQLVAHVEKAWLSFVCTLLAPAVLCRHHRDGWVWCLLRLPGHQSVAYEARHAEAVRYAVRELLTDGVAVVWSDGPGFGSRVSVAIYLRGRRSPRVLSWDVEGEKLGNRRDLAASAAPAFADPFAPPTMPYFSP